MEKNYTLMIGGVLALTLAWNFPAFTFLIFVGFVPLLYILFSKAMRFRKALGLAYLFILLWQLGSTFWLFRTNVLNVVLLNLINSFLPACILAFAAYLHTQRSQSRWQSYLFVLLAWVGLEFVQHHWEMAFPLLTLGNALGDWPGWIQWYEWTGVLGGSVWIVAANMVFTEAFLLKKASGRFQRKPWVIASATLLLPIGVSFLFLAFVPTSSSESVEIVSVHPDMDCYTEKYDLPAEEVVYRHLAMSLPAITAQTDYLLWPETAVPDGGWTNTVAQDPLWVALQDTLARYPGLTLVSGAVMYEPLRYKPRGNDPLVRYQTSTQTFFRTYNAAVQVAPGAAMQMRTKQQLVAFEETLPYAQTLSFLDGMVSSLGNFAFSASRNNQHVFEAQNGHRVTPLICYETAFGESTAGYVRQGAQLLMVILNEGWYQNYYGARQFMRLSQVRAIETRRAVARSSNFGATGFIDPTGNIVTSTTAFEPNVLTQSLPLRNGLTFYVRYGDYLGRLALAGLVLQLIWLLLRRKKPQPPQKRSMPKAGTKQRQLADPVAAR